MNHDTSAVKLTRDFLPADVLDEVLVLFHGAADWVTTPQESQYGERGQSFDGAGLPLVHERYSASFDVSASLQESPAVLRVSSSLNGKTVRCYRMGQGQGFRVHTDSYFQGGLSHVLYLNDGWGWDWGGLLHVLSDDGLLCDVVRPEMNLLVTTDCAAGKVPHFVSPVAPWAQQPRYVLAVFGEAPRI